MRLKGGTFLCCLTNCIGGDQRPTNPSLDSSIVFLCVRLSYLPSTINLLLLSISPYSSGRWPRYRGEATLNRDNSNRKVLLCGVIATNTNVGYPNEYVRRGPFLGSKPRHCWMCFQVVGHARPVGRVVVLVLGVCSLQATVIVCRFCHVSLRD